MARPITEFTNDLTEALAPNPTREVRLGVLTRAVDTARTNLTDAIAALGAAQNEHARTVRAGRLLRDLGYEVPAEPPPAELAADAPREDNRPDRP